MEFLFPIVLAIHFLVGASIIGLVLLQHGKGADMGAAFGSGASGSLFGASGSANFLSRTTAALAAVFFFTSLALTWVATNRPKAASSIMDSGQPQAPAPVTVPLPGGTPAPAEGATEQKAAPAGESKTEPAASEAKPDAADKPAAEGKPGEPKAAGGDSGAAAEPAGKPGSEAKDGGAAEAKPVEKKAGAESKPAGAGEAGSGASKVKEIPK
jgi:preprotein translocase subunit SecG